MKGRDTDFMNRLETTQRITYEITMGYTWGHPASLVEQTEENRAKWERMESQIKQAADLGWEIELPHDLTDISD